MAGNEKKAEEKAEAKQAPAPSTKVEAAQAAPSMPPIPKERLIAESTAFLGVPSWDAAAALHDVEDGDVSVDEARKLVEKFLAPRRQGQED